MHTPPIRRPEFISTSVAGYSLYLEKENEFRMQVDSNIVVDKQHNNRKNSLASLYGLRRLIGQSRLTVERGSNLVESAILMPLFMLIMLGVVDLGMGFGTYISLTNAAREGARWMTINPNDRNGTIARVYNEIQNAGLTPADIEIDFIPDRQTYESGDRVTIQVSHEYEVMFGALNQIPPLNFQITASMRVLYSS